MTTTCFRPAPTMVKLPSAAVRQPALRAWQAMARLGSWVRALLQARQARRQDANALDYFNAHQLQDIGAPKWLQQRAASREALDRYEHFKAMTRLKY